MRASRLFPWVTALTTLVSIAAAAVLATAPSATAMAAAVQRGSTALPLHLRDTGLYEGSEGPTGMVLRARALPFTPQYTLWSDGADKRRWILLPPGQTIDARRADAWVFPVGTRLWKEFSHAGRPVETRYLERLADGQWRFASYVWNEAGTDAVLAPELGISAMPLAQAPGGRYDIPSRSDCLACHGGAAVPVLGFGALQLSPDRDPNAVHAAPLAGSVDLRSLAGGGLLRGLPPALLAEPPRIPAATPLERAALGYLHANCAHCHHHDGQPVPVRLALAQSVSSPSARHAQVLQSTVNADSRYRPPGGPAEPKLVVPGRPGFSVLALRMRSRHPQVQMPPIGTRIADPEGLALIERWIASDLPSATHTQEKQP